MFVEAMAVDERTRATVEIGDEHAPLRQGSDLRMPPGHARIIQNHIALRIAPDGQLSVAINSIGWLSVHQHALRTARLRRRSIQFRRFADTKLEDGRTDRNFIARLERSLPVNERPVYTSPPRAAHIFYGAVLAVPRKTAVVARNLDMRQFEIGVG